MPIIPGSSGGGNGQVFPLNHAVSQKIILQKGHEIEAIPSNEEQNPRKYWIYNAGQTTILLRGRSSDSLEFVDFPLLPGYMFEDTDKDGLASGWYAISEENEGILNIHIKSKSPLKLPTTVFQDWVKPATASWQPSSPEEETAFFMEYAGDYSHPSPVTVQVNTSDRRAYFISTSSLEPSFDAAIEGKIDSAENHLFLNSESQGTYQWHYKEYPFLIAFDIIGAYDNILVYKMSLNMLSGFPIISLSQSTSIY